MNKHKPIKGFTLIELSLSMVFISLLSLAVVLIIMNTVSSYRRGLTMNQVNSAGQEIIDDIRVAIQNSSSTSIKSQCGAAYEDENDRKKCENDNGSYLVSVARSQEIKITGDSSMTVPVFGAICTGKYSYIWNSGYSFSSSQDVKAADGGSITKASLKITDETEIHDFRLLKVSDYKRVICAQNIKSYPANSGQTITLEKVFEISRDVLGNEDPVDLIGGESNLAVYDLNMLAPAESNDGSNLFYSGSMILGTIRGGPDIRAENSSCKSPDKAISDLDYCAINKFKFAVQANGNGA